MTPAYYEYLGWDYRTVAPRYFISGKQKGVIDKCIYFYVDEELNGPYTCEFQVSILAKCANEIIEGTRIKAKPNDVTDYDVFEITSKRVDTDTITFYGEQIHCCLKKSVNTYPSESIEFDVGILPKSNIEQAINVNNFSDVSDFHSKNDLWFLFDTDVENYELGRKWEGIHYLPYNAMDFLMRLQETFGGDWQWNKLNIYLWKHRGDTDKHVIRTGKNLLRLSKQSDNTAYINCVTPYWVDDEESDVAHRYSSAVTDDFDTSVDMLRIGTVRLNDVFDSDPGAAAAKSHAEGVLSETVKNALESSTSVEISTNTNTDGVLFKNYKIGDEADVWFEQVNLRLENARIVKLRYDSINERTVSVTVGKLEETYGDVIRDSIDVSSTPSYVVPSNDAVDVTDQFTISKTAGKLTISSFKAYKCGPLMFFQLDCSMSGVTTPGNSVFEGTISGPWLPSFHLCGMSGFWATSIEVFFVDTTGKVTLRAMVANDGPSGSSWSGVRSFYYFF